VGRSVPRVDLEAPVAGGERLLEAPQQAEHAAAVGVELRELRVELDRAVEFREGLAEPAEVVAKHHAATVVGPDDPRVDLDGPVEGRKGPVDVLDRPVFLAQLAEDQTRSQACIAHQVD
jgi:hypothetical protein